MADNAKQIRCDVCGASASVQHQEPITNTVRDAGHPPKEVHAGTRYQIFCPKCGIRAQTVLRESK
jgi:hypothetical protein